MLIHTPHLKLSLMRENHLSAISSDPKLLEKILGVKYPEGWPNNPSAYLDLKSVMAKNPQRVLMGWWFFLVINHLEKRLIGAAGFRDLPDKNGIVEVGYEIAPEFLSNGFDAEIGFALIKFAFTRSAVQKVNMISALNDKDSDRILRDLRMSPINKNFREMVWEITRSEFEN